MVFNFKKPNRINKAPKNKLKAKSALNLTGFAISAAMLSSCVGTDSASVFEGVEPQAVAPSQTTPQVEQTEQGETSTPSSTPSTQRTLQPVPLGQRLPSPVASNYLPRSAPTLSQQQIAQPNSQVFALAALDDDLASTNSVLVTAETTPVIDPIEAAADARIPELYNSISHGKCKAEWAPKPKRVEAKRITTGDKYYVELRMRNTPLMPVGHTFVVYGTLDGNGEPTSERMAMLSPLGGYAGAGIAAAIPVPGVLTPYGDDCKLRPETAYRVSLNSQRYEKFLLELQKVKKDKPVYMLFAQNCNHFTQRMADAVGIKPPKNKLVPAVDYLYDLIEANEGIKIDTRYRSKMAGIPDWPNPNEIKKQRQAQGL